MSAPSSVITLVKILHPDLPGGVLRLQKFTQADYDWQGELYQFRQGFDLEGGGAVYQGCNVASSGLRLIVPLLDKRRSPKRALTEYVVARGLLGALCQIIQIFPDSGIPPQLAEIPLDSLVVKDSLAIWNLQAPNSATGRSILGVHPNRQFTEY